MSKLAQETNLKRWNEELLRLHGGTFTVDTEALCDRAMLAVHTARRKADGAFVSECVEYNGGWCLAKWA